MYLPLEFFNYLRDKILVSEIVSEKTNLKKKGKEFSGLCPFHNEKSPSFTVNDHKKFYHCFGCGAHGDVIKFIAETSGLKYSDAAIKLAERYNIALPKTSKTDQVKYEKKEQLFKLNEKILDFYNQQFLASNGFQARDYCQKRKLSAEIIKNFKIGYAANKALIQYAKQEKIDQAELKKLGLIASGYNGDYEVFRDRIIFPIIDIHGKIYGFGGRTLGDAKPKYLNSPETKLFHKGTLVYNEHQAFTAGYKTNEIILTEGYMDVIALASHGFENAVASLGTAVTANQLKRIWNFADKIIICLDGDEAGQKAANRIIDEALPILKSGKQIKFIQLPEKQDPDDYLQAHGAEAFKELKDNALSFSEKLWLREKATAEINNIEGITALEANLNKQTNLINDNLLKNNIFNYFKSNLWQLKKQITQATKPTPKQPSIQIKNKDDDSRKILLFEYKLLTEILHNPKLIIDSEELARKFQDMKFHDPELKDINMHVMDFFEHELTETEQTTNLQSDLLNYIKNSGFSQKINILLGDFNKDSKTEINFLVKKWLFIYDKYHLILLKKEYKNLVAEGTEQAFAKAKIYYQQISKLQTELNLKISKLETE